MKCEFRACKHNNEGECSKYITVEEMVEDFRNGQGCAFTWFFSGQLPKKSVIGE